MPVATLARDYEWEMSPLCEGGFGQIYLVPHPRRKQEGKLLIMKVIEIPADPDAMWVPRMEYEALQRIQKCTNANLHLVEQPHFGRDNMWWSAEYARMFLLFDYYPRNLDQLVKEEGRPKPAYIKTIIHDIVCGLNYLHGLKIIHKDVKPENIFVDRHGVYKIGDMGAALVYGVYDPTVNPPISSDVCNLTTNDPGVRSYNYTAPETIIPIAEKGPDGCDQWTYNESIDFWSLGMLAYELVVGRIFPWCKYVPDGPDIVLIHPRFMPLIMTHVLASHTCDPEIFKFIIQACHPSGLDRLRREPAMAIVEEWPAYTDHSAGRFNVGAFKSPTRSNTNTTVPDFMLKKEGVKEINETARQFKIMLKATGADIPERPKYRYLLSNTSP